MSEQNNTVATCQNGHQQNVAGSKFCVHCGQPLKILNFQAKYNPAQNNMAFNQPPVNPQPFVPPDQQPYNQSFRQSPNPLPQSFQPPTAMPYYPPTPTPHLTIQSMSCHTCGGNGQGLSEKTIICRECNWLRPLFPGYQIDASAFEWAADGRAMSALRSMKTLNAAARTVSEKVGRHWIEAAFNGILLNEKQLPHIYSQAVRAARILGVSHMPDVYVSGERAWDCLTFGTDKDSFIIIGSALAGNFQGADLLFLLAREMGHCRAGHALWKTVIKFLVGERGTGKGMMSGGIFNAILNPTSLIEGAIEMPLLAWARQAEVTADRAGLLAIGGDTTVMQRVLLLWALKSPVLCRQINIEAWLEQQSADDDSYSRLSELATSSTPYLIPRLKLLTEFARSPELQYWSRMISETLRQSAPSPPAPLPAKPVVQPEIIKLKCANCQTLMQIPQKALAGKTELPIKCPNAKCRKVTRLKKKASPEPNKSLNLQKLKENEENMNYGD